MERVIRAANASHAARRGWKTNSLAWAMAVVSIIIAITSLGIAVPQAMITGDFRTILSHQTLTPFITVGFAIIGALVASRHSHHPIGWMFTAVGFLYALVALSAALLINRSPAAPLYQWAYWFGSWLWIPAIVLPMTFVLL